MGREYGRDEIRDALAFLPFRELVQGDRNDAVKVGEALHGMGWRDLYDGWVPDAGSAESEKQWDHFGVNPNRAGVGVLVSMARERGWEPRGGDAADGGRRAPANPKRGTKAQPPCRELAGLPGLADVEPPDELPWDAPPERQLAAMLRDLYREGERVCIVAESGDGKKTNRDGTMKRAPVGNGRAYDALALAAGLEGPDGAQWLARVLDARHPEGGAWFMANPAKGEGHKATDVAERRYCLIEFDGIEDPREQLRIAARLRLPVACAIWSGNGSAHMIARIDAGQDGAEYRKRVGFMHAVINANSPEPADGQDKDASRLCRLAGALRGTNPQRLMAHAFGCPSWDAWAEFCAGHGVRYGGDGVEPPEDPGGTKSKTARTTGAPTVDMLADAIRSDPEWEGLAYNEMDGTVRVRGGLPWGDRVPMRSITPESGREWGDHDDAQAYARMQTTEGARKRDDVRDAVAIVARERAYNPLTEMLDALPKWDGTPRCETIFSAFLGVDDAPHEREAQGLFMRAMAARAWMPGEKFDNAPILSGAQGIGKSTLLRMLARRDEWFTDAVIKFGDDQKSGEAVRGRWVVEMSELAGMRASEVEDVKQFVTKQHDRYRAPYGRRVMDQARTCVIAGTTNSLTFLKDRSGNRRFWPMRCGAARPTMSVFDHSAATEYIRQALAEANALYLASPGLPLALSRESEAAWARQAAGFVEEQQWEPDVREFLDLVVGSDESRRYRVCVSMILREALGMGVHDSGIDRRTFRDVTEFMDGMRPEWVRVGRQRSNWRGNEYSQAQCWEYRGAPQN